VPPHYPPLAAAARATEVSLYLSWEIAVAVAAAAAAAAAGGVGLAAGSDVCLGHFPRNTGPLRQMWVQVQPPAVELRPANLLEVQK